MTFHVFQPTASKTNNLIIKAGTPLLAFGVEKIPFLSNITFWNSGFVQADEKGNILFNFFLEK